MISFLYNLLSLGEFFIIIVLENLLFRKALGMIKLTIYLMWLLFHIYHMKVKVKLLK